jgi:hypothetical protein
MGGEIKMNMKKIILSVAITLTVIFCLAPYYIGKLQHDNVVRVCQNFMNDDGEPGEWGTDGDIEDVLRVFHFNLGVFDTPTTKDYYIAGWKIFFNL